MAAITPNASMNQQSCQTYRAIIKMYVFLPYVFRCPTASNGLRSNNIYWF